MSLRYWLGISRWHGLHFRAVQAMLSKLDLALLFTLPVNELINSGLKEEVAHNREHIDWQAVDADMAWAQQERRHILCFSDKAYPPLLRQIARPPVVLYIYGAAERIGQAGLAIVGSRKPSALGKETAYAFAQTCASLNIPVCSGLAYGIDAAAHRGAVEMGGITFAILGSGLDSIYPKAHIGLAEEIADKGAIISEFPPDIEPSAAHFPQRNRIISGLSAGVLVVEAATQSGSLITARYALEQGREVFAVPGSIYNPLSRGGHLLIRQGAILVESIEDIIKELGDTVDIFGNNRQDVEQLEQGMDINRASKLAMLSSVQQVLWGVLEAPSSLDELIRRSELPVKQLRHELIQLELLGYAKEVHGRYQRCWPAL